MSRIFSRCVVLLVLFATMIGRASAWNDTGHQIVGLLAFQALDDRYKKKVIAILKGHPHYDEYLIKKTPPGAKFTEGIAMNAATWPDWIRTPKNHKNQFHEGTWHYINKPYIVAEPGDTETLKEIQAAFSKKPNHGDIVRVIAESRDILKAPANTKEEKRKRAVRLCWLFHTVGDIHQPLHAVALCTKELPSGDLGGNVIYVTPKKGQAPKKLHAVWDHMLGDHDDVTGIVRDIQDKTKVSEDDRKVTDPDMWADESVKIAKTSVYNFKGKAVGYVIDMDPDSHGPSAAPVLPEDYRTEGIELARQRVALAGLRLADILKSALED